MDDCQLITIHPTALVSPLADLEQSLRNTRIVIGAECSIDSFVKIKPAGGVGDVVWASVATSTLAVSLLWKWNSRWQRRVNSR